MWKLTMKSVVSSDGEKTFLYPIKVYCYTPVKQSIQKLLQQVDTDGDIYDGEVHKQFKDNTGRLCFTDKRNIGVMLNPDWFNPFENTEYSLGVI